MDNAITPLKELDQEVARLIHEQRDRALDSITIEFNRARLEVVARAAVSGSFGSDDHAKIGNLCLEIVWKRLIAFENAVRRLLLASDSPSQTMSAELLTIYDKLVEHMLQTARRSIFPDDMNIFDRNFVTRHCEIPAGRTQQELRSEFEIMLIECRNAKRAITTTVNLIGPNSRFNHNSVDASTNVNGGTDINSRSPEKPRLPTRRLRIRDTALSPDALLLLKKVSKSTHGQLLRVESHDGYSLSIDGTDFLPDTMDPRKKVWGESLVEDLVGTGCMAENGDSDVFTITPHGYKVVESAPPVTP